MNNNDTQEHTMNSTESPRATTHTISFRKHGESWKTAVFLNEALLDEWLDRYDRDCAEVRFDVGNGGER